MNALPVAVDAYAVLAVRSGSAWGAGLGLAWAAWLLAGFARNAAPVRLPSNVGAPRSLVTRFGRAVRCLARRPPSDSHDHRVGWSLLVSVVAVAVAPVPGLALGFGVWAWLVLRQRGQARRRTLCVVDELPEVIDLLRVAVTTGASPVGAVQLVAQGGRGPVAEAFTAAVTRVERGAGVADALDHAASQVSELAPLVRALIAAERYGAPLEQALAELGTQARHDRRRRVEAAARQVGVKLLFPLVLCVLPAFVVLTIVPTLAGTIARLAA